MNFKKGGVMSTDRFRAERYVLSDLRKFEQELIEEIKKGEMADAEKVEDLTRSLNTLWSLVELEAVWPSEVGHSANAHLTK